VQIGTKSERRSLISLLDMTLRLRRILFGCILLALLGGTSSVCRSSGLLVNQQQPKRSTVVHKELEGTVEVSLRVNEDGKVDILTLAATSPQLAEYVIQKLGQIALEKNAPQIGQVIRYRFVFKKQA